MHGSLDPGDPANQVSERRAHDQQAELQAKMCRGRGARLGVITPDVYVFETHRRARTKRMGLLALISNPVTVEVSILTMNRDLTSPTPMNKHIIESRLDSAFKRAETRRWRSCDSVHWCSPTPVSQHTDAFSMNLRVLDALRAYNLADSRPVPNMHGSRYCASSATARSA